MSWLDRMEEETPCKPSGGTFRWVAKRLEVCAYDRGLTIGGGALTEV